MTAGPAVAIPRVLHQTWRTATPPPRLAAFRETWLRHHPRWTHRFWTDEELRAFVATSVPDLLAIYDAYEKPICRVDMARYLILERLGGVYADLDMECLRPLDPLLDGRQLVIGREPDRHGTFGHSVRRGMERFWCPSVIASIPGHPYWREVRRGLVRARHARDVLDATGPYLLTRAHARYRGSVPVTELEPETFYPIDKNEAWSGALFALDRREAATRTAYAIHHWDGTWFRRRPADEVEPMPRRIAVHLTRGGVQGLEDDVGPAQSMELHLDHRDHPVPPLVSCLMVTRARAPLAAVAIECFRRQTWPERELVIVDDDPDDALARHVRALDEPAIRLVRLPSEGRTLGELRTRALAEARGSHVCQWDDDDLQDPLRIEIQMETLARTRAAACYLRRWTQWWPAAGRIALSTRRIWEGSMLARKDVVPPYPTMRRGEDSAPTIAICREHRVVHVDVPRLAVYVAHGRNTHHAVHYENMWAWATARFAGERYRAVRDELARRLPIDAYEGALAAMAASAPDPQAAAHPPPSVRPAGDLRAFGRQSASARPARALAAWEALLADDAGDAEALAGRAAALGRLTRFDEAEAAYLDLERRRPGDPAGPLGRAHVAIARGDRAAALARCEEAARLPANARVALQRADLLLRLDRPEEADRAFADAGRDPRAAPAAAVGRATAAVDRQDWEAAVALWQAAWRRHRASEAPIGIVAALVHLGRPADARAFVDGIADAPALRRQASLRLARLLHDWDAILAILDGADPTLPVTPDERRLHVEALLVADLPDRALAVLPPDGTSGAAAFQAVRVLLRAGRLRPAHDRLLAAVLANGIGRLPIELLPELLAVRRARGGHAAVHRVLDRIESARAIPHELQLAVPYERHAEEWRAWLAVADALTPGAGPTEATIVDRLGPPGPAEAPNVARLRHAGAEIATIRARHSAVFPDPMTSLADALAVAERIAGAIARAEPLALLRLGDGEGNFLPYAAGEERHRRADQASIQRIWWSGTPLPEADARAIERGLAAAIQTADVVGIPELYRLCRLCRAGLPPNQTSRGALAVVAQFAGSAPVPDGGPIGRPDQIVTGAHVHTAFEHWRMWDLVLARAGACTLVTGRGDAAEGIARRFAIAVDRVHRVPGERKYRRDVAAPAEAPHYPDRFRALRAELRVQRPGEVFLVAAGVLGKIYCAWIRSQGGIALDVGSALDHWCGQSTRTSFEATWLRPPRGLLASYAARPSLDAAHPDLAPAATAARLLARRGEG